MDLERIINESNLSAEEVRFLAQQGFAVASEAEQGTPEWLEARLGKVTASRAKDVVARNRYGKPYQGYYDYIIELAIERLTGKAKRFSNRYMTHGIENEEAAAELYALQTGYEIKETGFHEHPDLMAGASPDRLVEGDGEIEIKAPNSDTLIRYMISMLDEDDPDYELVAMLGLKGDEWKYYFEQIQMQLWITNRKWCDFVVYDPDLPENSRLVIERVDRDDQFIDGVMVPAIREFLEKVNRLEFYLRGLNGGLEDGD